MLLALLLLSQVAYIAEIKDVVPCDYGQIFVPVGGASDSTFMTYTCPGSSWETFATREKLIERLNGPLYCDYTGTSLTTTVISDCMLIGSPQPCPSPSPLSKAEQTERDKACRRKPIPPDKVRVWAVRETDLPKWVERKKITKRKVEVEDVDDRSGWE